ncbi:TRAP transporter substrate-binding protein DctP, partial [Chloroflexota bacterium]
EYIGGPEVMGAFDIGMAAKQGVVDIGWVFATGYAGLVPGVGVLSVSPLTPSEERETGFHDALADMHEKSGLFYLGRGVIPPRPEFYFELKKRIETPYDLVGLKIGPGTMVTGLMEDMGVASIFVRTMEIYGALERGVIDGVVFPITGYTDFRFYEVAEYVIDHGVLTSNITTTINLDTWNKLPEHLQKLMIEAQLEYERDYPVQHGKFEAEKRQILKDAGIEFIKFSPSDAEWFIENAYDAEWGKILRQNPEIAPLREMTY